MNLSSIFNFKWNKSIKEAPKGTAISANNLKNFIIKAVGIATGGSNANSFQSPEYSLSEIKIAAQSDSYIKISMQKYCQLVFKAGYKIVSQNDAAAEYIRTRFRTMSFSTGTPMDVTFQEIADDMIKYSNAFLLKSRMDVKMANAQAKGVYDSKPVAGYFRVDPTTIQIKRDATGTVKQYQQQVDSTTKTFKPTDVIHFYLDKEGGAAFGTPRVVAALEDVKLLRKIEGNILSLIYRFCIPLYQMKIGLPEAGFMATDTEIKDAKYEIEKMSPDGMMVTNERTSFHAIGAEGEALDATGYLTYFEKRAFSALNMSEAMMGRGGAKQDADSMEGQVHDTVKAVQRRFSILSENFVINELLLEGGFDPIGNEADIVKFEFEEINLDTKVKMENHSMTQFQGNSIAFEEMRQGMGLRGDNVDEGRLYANMVQQKNAIEQIDAKNNGALQIAGARAGTSAGTSVNSAGGNGKVKQVKASGTIKNNNRPANQHGTTSASIKESMTDSEKNIDSYKKNFNGIYKRYQSVRNDICVHNEKPSVIFPIARDGIVKELKKEIAMMASGGITQAAKDSKKQINSEKIVMIQIEKMATDIVTSLFKDIQKKIEVDGADRQLKESVFDSMEYRLRFLVEHIISKSYWYAYVKSCSQMDINKVYVIFNSDEDKKKHKEIINTKSFDLEDIPAFNSYCGCAVSLKKAGDK